MSVNSLQSLMQRLERGRDFALMMGIIGVVALMIIPLPPLLLDLLLTVNITIAVLVLLTSIYVMRPLDFSVFPALLLITTLFRLGLNVASTRLILLGASEGQANAGKIIDTFGEFVVGGSTAVGVIVFLILVVINFMVITKGAGRIAEVTARFTLDALPGKQMAVDAELASGAISDVEARQRRDEVGREADFYGAMDGASKFVRGDAIAGLIITGINIIAGLMIGVSAGGMGVGDAASRITVLTVGDGLVSQIPALLISAASGLIVTRAASATDFSGELGSQILGNHKVLIGASAVLFLLGLVPGMPLFVFWTLAAAIGYLAFRVQNGVIEGEEGALEGDREAEQTEPEIDELLEVDPLTLEIGYGLVSLVNEANGGTLLKRMLQMRRQFADELGIVVPPIHVRDNLSLAPGAYRLLLRGVAVGEGELEPNRLLAINPGGLTVAVEGTPTKDPTFGLDALWIHGDDRFAAEACGLTVVELDGVVTTHVSELLRQCSPELFGWQELQERFELVRQRTPKLVDELVPKMIGFSLVLKVLRGLLAERVSIRDMQSILEAIAEHAETTKSVSVLQNQVRARLAPQISAMFADESGTVHAALLARDLEERLRQCIVSQDGEPVLACDLATAQGVFNEIENVMGAFAARDAETVILAPPDLRGPLARFLAQFFPNIHVICHREVSQRVQIVSLGQLTLANQSAADQLAA